MTRTFLYGAAVATMLIGGAAAAQDADAMPGSACGALNAQFEDLRSRTFPSEVGPQALQEARMGVALCEGGDAAAGADRLAAAISMLGAEPDVTFRERGAMNESTLQEGAVAE